MTAGCSLISLLFNLFYLFDYMYNMCIVLDADIN
jgi:hypothetical protein